MPFLTEDDKRLIFQDNSIKICPPIGKTTGKATGVKMP